MGSYTHVDVAITEKSYEKKATVEERTRQVILSKHKKYTKKEIVSRWIFLKIKITNKLLMTIKSKISKNENY